MEEDQVKFLKGDTYQDSRGQLHFVNQFDFQCIKRFYQITHQDVSVIRAWQGHRNEEKHFFVVKGKFLVAWVKVDDWVNPSPSLKAEYRILSGDEPGILQVPPGHANGIKALEADSILTVYSNLSLEQSAADRWSYDLSNWLDWNAF